jgi:hypothetical protein
MQIPIQTPRLVTNTCQYIKRKVDLYSFIKLFTVSIDTLGECVIYIFNISDIYTVE